MSIITALRNKWRNRRGTGINQPKQPSREEPTRKKVPARSQALLHKMDFLLDALKRPPRDAISVFSKDWSILEVLLDNPYDKDALYAFARHVLAHLDMSPHGFVIELTGEGGSRFNVKDKENVGSYQRDNRFGLDIITIEVKSDFNEHNVLAILCHELMHRYLRANDVALADTDENEMLTDVATIYFGMANYMQIGYRVSEKREHQSDRTVIHKNRLGYITTEEIDFVMANLDRLRKRFEKREAVRKQAEQDERERKARECADRLDVDWLIGRMRANISLARSAAEYFGQLLDEAEVRFTPTNDEDARTIQTFFYSRECGADAQAIERFEEKIASMACAPSLDMVRVVDAEVTACLSRMTMNNAILRRCVS